MKKTITKYVMILESYFNKTEKQWLQYINSLEFIFEDEKALQDADSLDAGMKIAIKQIINSFRDKEQYNQLPTPPSFLIKMGLVPDIKALINKIVENAESPYGRRDMFLTEDIYLNRAVERYGYQRMRNDLYENNEFKKSRVKVAIDLYELYMQSKDSNDGSTRAFGGDDGDMTSLQFIGNKDKIKLLLTKEKKENKQVNTLVGDLAKKLTIKQR